MTSEIFPEEERCADPIDEAGRTEARMRANDIAKAQFKARPEQVQLKDEDNNLYWPITACVDCGDDIPTPRLNLAKIRCLLCQEKRETRGRQHGKSEI